VHAASHDQCERGKRKARGRGGRNLAGGREVVGDGRVVPDGRVGAALTGVCEAIGCREDAAGGLLRSEGGGHALDASTTAWAESAGARAVEDAEHSEREQVSNPRANCGVAKPRSVLGIEQEE
jgi:hypothetical protein